MPPVEVTRTRGANVPAPIAWMNDRVVPASEATIPLLDDGFLRGDAIFEGIMVRRGHTHALEAHLARMRRSAKVMGIRLPVLRKVVADLMVAWGDRDGSLRLIVTRSGAVRGLVQATNWPATTSLAVVDAPWRSALSNIKTLSYAANMWAQRQALAAEADDAVIVYDGIVQELPTAAICWVRDGTIFAPDPAQVPILESVTVRELMKVVDIELGAYPVADLLRADEAFVISATRPVLPVHAIDDVEFDAPGPITKQAHEALATHVDATLDPLP